MIKGIEDFDTKLQKSILGCIATLFDLSEDIEVIDLGDHVIQIDDIKYYVITDDDQQRILTTFNKEKFDDYFDDLSTEQLIYVNEDLWMEDYGITSFQEWLEEETEWTVEDTDYYGSHNFYEIR